MKFVTSIWIRVGADEKRRFIPIHTLHQNMDRSLCKVLLALHLGTGCDYLSKIGTKLSALNANPEEFLTDFSEAANLDEDVIKQCERYLVKVYDRNAKEATFDELRCRQYKNNDSVFDLAPTSYSIINGHIPRWHYLYREYSNLLNQFYNNSRPEDHGWVLENGVLLPNKFLLLVPDKLTNVCNCKPDKNLQMCKYNRCKCKRSAEQCTEYCGCQSICCNIDND